MADTLNSITGEDVQIILVRDGSPVVIDVEEFNEDSEETMIAHKPIGTSKVYHDRRPEGWKGTLAILHNSPNADELFDTLDTNARNRVASVVNIGVSRSYRDGSQKRYTYPDVKLHGYSGSTKRGEGSKVRLNWACGNARVAG